MTTERSRKNASTIFQAIAKVGQNTVASRTGLSETKISRLKTEEVSMSLDMIAGFLTAIDLKCVPIDVHCYDTESIQSILTLARQRMAQLEGPEQLVWGE